MLFGPGLMEKASKMMEAGKALVKIAAPGNSQKLLLKDKVDLHHFLFKSALGKYGSQKSQCQYKPYNQSYSRSTANSSYHTTKILKHF